MNNLEEHSREQKAGMKCPICGKFIETSINQLLTPITLECPSCHLHVNIGSRSKKELDALRKVEEAQKSLEQRSKFNK